MGFKDLNIKIKYDSDNSDILNEFYIPILSQSVEYYRLSGFFSSTSLAVSAIGLEDFIKNNGKMKLVCSSILSEDDFVLIEEVYNSPEEFIVEKFLMDYDDISDTFINDNLAALGFMLANGNLEIKIAILDESKGIFHSKTGIMVDDENNMISFSGSDNETAYGWKYNIEEFKVFKNWVDGQKEYFVEDLDNFNQYWDNLTFKSEVIDLPTAISNKLIKLAPSNISEIHIVDNIISDETMLKNEKSNKNELKLREYQKEAVDNWVNNNYSGILSMATGTGKTITALFCFDYLKKMKSKLLTVIVCPQKHLISQWEDNLKKFNFDGHTLVASGDNIKWKSKLLGLIGDLKSDLKNNVVVFTTFNTFSNNKFINIMSLYDGESLVIVDEVHGIGSSEFRKGFDVCYTYKLGLSATPDIEDDFERNDFIYETFNNVVYEYGLEKAIDNGFLTHYNYYPEFIDLNNREFEEYEYYTFKIVNLLNKKKKTVQDENNLKKSLIKRRNIINNAEAKMVYLKEFLSKNMDIKDLIIYCTGEQMPKVQRILDELDIPNRKFTGEESTKKVRGKSERDKILELFAKGHYHALVAIKCLDEGVDVPSTQTALLMASTLNSRQHIQRRGRILRKSPGKKIANIYDLIVFPCMKNKSDSIENIFRNEQKRYDEYADLADNFSECSRKFIERWEKCK